jgi:hypothetical protein
MKNIVLGVLLLINIISFGQEINFKDLSTSSKGKFTSYVSKDNVTYKIGDRIKIGFPSSSNKTFTFITQGGEHLPAFTSGREPEIEKILVLGDKRSGYCVYFSTDGMGGFLNYIIQFENALSVGEVKGFGKTSDEALSELKKAKDKLDLGLITQEEFEDKKTELVKFIKD